jgi:hypothetical protein
VQGGFFSKLLGGCAAFLCTWGSLSATLEAAAPQGTPVDQLLAQENSGRKLQQAPVIDDLAFLRRVTVDLIGRIPSEADLSKYLAWPANERRQLVVEALLKDPRFADRWTAFYADLLRLRANADGGPQLTAFVHKAIEEDMPYDVMCRQLISAGGKVGKSPEVGFVLGDAADPMALAAASAQVFMGIRISCAQCHDHPFDVWKREQFYGLAAFFGKTRRIENDFTKAVYTTELDKNVILWPPEGVAPADQRKPMPPTFPFEFASAKDANNYVTRFEKARADRIARAEQANKKDKDTQSVDDLLGEAESKVRRPGADKPKEFDVVGEAKREAEKLQVEKDLSRASKLRGELALLVTNPRNKAFSRNFVNRLWHELLGHGFVEPVDDFSDHNLPSHPQTLDYLSDEFVASAFDFRTLIRTIVASQAYQRGHVYGADLATQQEAEGAFVAAPVRRMISESLFDSIVLAGHLFGIKHKPGDNVKIVKNYVRVPVGTVASLAKIKPEDGKPAGMAGMGGMNGQMARAGGGYDLESAIEVNFDALLKPQEDAPNVEVMKISDEDMESRKMLMERQARTKYVDRVVETTVDDNPLFTSALRMPTPAPPTHFLRIFGQTSRDVLGEHRDHTASMRQALMMLNGRLTHEASRVGKLEPMHDLLVGKNANPAKAVTLAYHEILTREPSAEELADAQQILKEAEGPLNGMADLRWVLFNSHEFRFLP